MRELSVKLYINKKQKRTKVKRKCIKTCNKKNVYKVINRIMDPVIAIFAYVYSSRV